MGAFALSSYSDLAGGKILAEGDTFWHLVVGQKILSTGVWPTADTYSFTAHGTPWITYEWLGEIAMALAAHLGGLRGLAVLLVLQSIVLVLLLYYFAWLYTGSVKAAAVACALLLPLTGIFFTLRPQLLGGIFLLITLICLENFRRGRSRALWVLPVVFLLWVNTHGSFLVGLLVLALYWASGLANFRVGWLEAVRWPPRQRRQLLGAGLGCVLAMVVTPYGTHLAAVLLALPFHQGEILRTGFEWQAVNFSTSYGLWFLVFLLVALVSQVLFPIVYRAEILAFLLFAIAESCLHLRFLMFFVIIFAPILATLLARWMPPYQAEKDHPWVNAALIALILGGAVALLPSNRKLDQALAKTYPVGAVDYLRQHPVPVGMFNEDTWGSFLIWSLGTRHRVFIDGRAEIYGSSGVLADYVRIISLDRRTPALLQAYHLKACLLHRGIPLETYFAALPGWERV